MKDKPSIKIYHGYGHTHNLVVYGHVFRRRAANKQSFSEKIIPNLLHLIRLFIVKPFPFIEVRLTFRGQVIQQTTAYDGFFKFEWAAIDGVEAGWHEVQVDALSSFGEVMCSGLGQIYVPHITQFAFISDIDDTIMVSHSATIGKRLRELFIKNPRTRKTFPGLRDHYQALAQSHTAVDQPNPFFYVSSSEWNLYDYLVETFHFNKLPEGTFLLNQLKRWKSLWRTGKNGHEGKLLRVMRILDAFPNQKFVFLGDNSQQDPIIYTTIAQKYPKNIFAIYIRNVRKKNEAETLKLLSQVQQFGIYTCLFQDSDEAFAHSKKIQLI